MKTPHDTFTQYVYSRDKEPRSFVPDNLPISKIEEFGKFPKKGSDGYIKWLKENDLKDLPKRMQLVYDMWVTKWSRDIICVLIMRSKEHLIIETLKTHGKWSVDDEQIDLYKQLFFDVEGWSGLDHLNYKFLLKAEEYMIYENSMGSKPYEALLFDLGAEVPPESADEVLNRLMAVSLHEFETTDDPKDKIGWGKFTFSLIKEKKKEKSDTSAQQVLDQLRFELPQVADRVHELGEDEEII